MSYTIHEIGSNELRDFVYRAFEDFCGKEVVSHVEVEHFNPSIIDISVYVTQKKNNEMRKYAAKLCLVVYMTSIRQSKQFIPFG